MSESKNNTAPLLSELETLKAVLQNKAGVDYDAIPVLSDVVAAPDTARRPPRPAVDDEYDFRRELFIQELVDSVMPNIEAELRKRLLQLDSKLLEQWYWQSQGSR